MKTFYLFLVALTISITANAQITKGNWMVGGSFKYNYQESETTSNNFTNNQKSFGFNLSADLGYFFKDKLVAGLVPSFGYGNPEGSNNSNIGIGIGPFARYYFLKADNRINVFSHIEYQFSNGYRQGDKTTETQNFNFKAGPAIFFNSSVAMELTLEYAYGKVNSFSGNGLVTKVNNFNIGVGFQIHLEKK